MDGYSLSAKNEIISLSFSTDCCKRAFLSALIHTGGSLVFGRGGMRVIIPAATEELRRKIAETLGEITDGVSVVKDGSETIIEGTGVTPHVDIENDPYLEYKGEDQQLNKAIQVILEKLKTEKNEIPPIPAFPNKAAKKK